MDKIKKFKAQTKKMHEAFLMTMKSSSYYTILGVLFCAALVVISYLSLYFNKEIINGVQELANNSGEREVKEVFLFLACFVVVIVIRGIIEVFDRYYSEKRLSVFQQYIDGQIVKKCRVLDISCFDSPKFYNQLEQVNSTKRMLGFLVYRVLFVTKAFFMFASAVVILVSAAQWYIVIGMILFMIPSFLYRGKCDYKIMQYENDNRRMSREMSYWCKIVFAKESAKELRLFNFSEYVVKAYSKLIDQFLKAKKKIISKYGLRESLVKILPYAVVFIGGLQLAYQVIGGSIELGDFIYYLGIYLTFISCLNELFDEVATVEQHMFAYDKYIDFMNMENSVKDEGKMELLDPKVIEFSDVWFRYPNTDRDVLRGFTCSFGYSEKIAIIGMNGEGKTTIIKLLLRFYDPDQGVIKINGRDIREYTIESLRKQFGLALQEFNIFSMSLRDNVTLSDWNRRSFDKDIEEALNFSEFNLNCDLDCDLRKDYSEDGRGLSGGEEQKIAIARCVFSNAGFLVMDEPTASLDAVAEAKLMSKYESIYKDKGLILVSHRLSNVRNMDKIVVLKGGVVLESGNHNELMSKKGEYSRLFSLQAERYES